MASRKGTASRAPNRKKAYSAPKKGGGGKKPWGVLFWLAFFAVTAGLFLVNREVIRRTLQNTGLFPGSDRSASETPEGTPGDAPAVTVPPSAGEGSPGTPSAGGPSRPPENSPAIPEGQRPPAGTKPQPPAAPPAQSAPGRSPESSPDRSPEGTKPQSPSVRPVAESRERTLYFTRVDRDGTILRTKVTRKIPLSDSPMVDALKILIQGPNAEEQRQGLVTLIPQGTRILAARVQGTTAYISFSEEFQYNTYGVEGYAAQLRQIVWTATEFPGVKDVQILIEGRRVDYLGEGIWIGSPVDRDIL